MSVNNIGSTAAQLQLYAQANQANKVPTTSASAALSVDTVKANPQGDSVQISSQAKALLEAENAASILTNGNGIEPPAAGILTNGNGIEPPAAGILTNGNGIEPPAAGILTNGNGIEPPAASILTNGNGIEPPTASILTNGNGIEPPKAELN